jgi:phosphoglycolate phosphatase-like HAD superfamily hydrolase
MPLDLPRIEAICFDLDGTLSDTDDLYVAGLARRLAFLRRLAPGHQPETLARKTVMALESPGNRVLRWVDRLGLDNLYYRYREKRLIRRTPDKSHFVAIQGVHAALADLQSRYPLALVSARESWSTEAILSQLELRNFFRCVISADSTPFAKPYPDPLLLAAEMLSVGAQNLLMVGDTTVDILAGKAVGAQTVGVLCGFGTRKELIRSEADLILASPAELPALLSLC